MLWEIVPLGFEGGVGACSFCIHPGIWVILVVLFFQCFEFMAPKFVQKLAGIHFTLWKLEQHQLRPRDFVIEVFL
jgi:hypothetical protein